MKVNSEFLENLLRWEGNRKQTRKYLSDSSSEVSESSTKENSGMKTPTSSPRSLSPRTRLSEDMKIQQCKTLFDKLLTKSGLNGIQNWFLDHATKEHTLNESQFVMFLRQLTDFRDWEILEIYDIFDKNGIGKIGWNEYYLLCALYSAHHSKTLTKFLYYYGDTVYKYFVDPVTDCLTFERFSRLGFLIAVPEEEILNTLHNFNIKKNQIENMTREDFLLFYFAILSKLDSGVDTLKEKEVILYSEDALANIIKGENAPETDSKNEKCSIS